MKKALKLLAFLLIFSLFAAFTFTAAADDGITVTVDGVALEFDVQPTIINGRTLVPVRGIFEALGAEVAWDAPTSTCTATRDSTVVKITIGADTMYVNGVAKALDTPGMIINSRTLIPLRAVSEAFDCGVSWEGSIRTAVILSDPDNYTVLYSLDGRSEMFANSDVEAQLSVGWYRVPSQMLYAADGRTQVFPKSSVAAQLSVGWYENRSDVFAPLYAPDGRVIEKPVNEIETYKNLGWYTEPQALEFEDDGTEDTYNWEYGSGYLFLYGDISGGGNVDTFSSLPWSDYKNSIHTLYVGYGIENLDSFAFDSHSNIHRVELSTTVTSIENYAFDKTAITRIGIPANVKTFNAYAFDTYGLDSNSSCNKNMVVYCEPGSYAESFAKNNGLSYVSASPVYYPDGRSCMVTDAEREIYLRYGWYDVPVATMYAADGRTLVCPVTNVAANEQVGWHYDKYDVYTVMYALDGRTLDVLNTEIATYQELGWYLFEDYICAKTDAYVYSDGYDIAATFLETIIALLKYADPYYDATVLDAKFVSLLSEWSDEIDCPLAITGTEITYSYGYPVANFSVRNLTDKTVIAFDANFTCYNAYGQKTYDYGGSSTIKSTASSTTLAPGEEATYTLTLYNNSETAYIDNIYIVRAAFNNGTTWYN